MVLYKCIRCNSEFDHKTHIKAHINRKKICEPIISNLLPKDYEQEILRQIHDINIIKEERIKRLENELNILKEELKKSSSSTAQTSSNTTNINNVNSNNNIDNSKNLIVNINITPYNDPNVNNITDDQRLFFMKKLFMSIPGIIKKIHFDENFPENHNILISNYRTKLSKVFDGYNWITKDEDDVIDDLIYFYERMFEDLADINDEAGKYLKKYKEIKERNGEEKFMNDLRKEIKRTIYDNRKIIKIKDNKK